MTTFEYAQNRYAQQGIDVEKALATLMQTPVSLPCWQGDDVRGFDRPDGGAGDGIQATGSYPGRARNFEELCADFDLACSLIPGKKRLNLHACYAVFPEGEWADRDRIEYRHFRPWVEYAKTRGLGIDFNPTCFSHPMVRGGLTLSSPDEEVRRFWIGHCLASRRIANQIAQALNDRALCNLWIPDGLKDIPADRFGPRQRLQESLDEIYAETMPHLIDSVESKVFGIGLESYTVGSNEFYLSYASRREGLCVLLDSGHFHPTENVSDKLSAMLPFFPYVPLHITRPVRWDSDHVVLFDDTVREILKEAVCGDALDRVPIGLDFFDASINRVAAWVVGTRSVQKALLSALLTPHSRLGKMQDEGNFTEKMMLSEALKTMPFGAVWEEACRRQGIPADEECFQKIHEYDMEILRKRS